ncbi:MAG: acyltransferase [Ferruginibacter sp.]
MNKQKYPSINGLRAMSITLVIIHHLSLQNNVFKNFSGVKWLRPFLLFITDGQMGVNVFFVISGFLITSLMLQEQVDTGSVSLKNFYIRRTLRIFPAYYFLLLVYFFIQLSGFIKIPNHSWLTAITYTKYFNWNSDWYTRHAWSLSIEEHFYILWPLVFIAGYQFRKRFAFALILIVPLIRSYIFFHPVTWINQLTIFTRIDAISMGCLFALFKNEIIKILSPYWTKIFWCAITTLFFLRYFPGIAHRFHFGFIFIPLGLTHGTIADILISLIMMYSVFGPKGIWFRILNWRVINYIGLLSYSIYLWQQLFISKTNYWINQVPGNIFLILLVATGSYYLIEKPFLNLKHKFSGTQNKIPVGEKTHFETKNADQG